MGFREIPRSSAAIGSFISSAQDDLSFLPPLVVYGVGSALFSAFVIYSAGVFVKELRSQRILEAEMVELTNNHSP